MHLTQGLFLTSVHCRKDQLKVIKETYRQISQYTQYRCSPRTSPLIKCTEYLQISAQSSQLTIKQLKHHTQIYI